MVLSEKLSNQHWDIAAFKTKIDIASRFSELELKNSDINQNDLKPEVVKKQDATYYRDKVLARLLSL